jgi:hypothetical protein
MKQEIIKNNMRAIDIDLIANGVEYAYKFIRYEGMDETSAIYNLVLNDFNEGFPLVIKFTGTLDDNIQSLASYIKENNFKIIDIRGDDHIHLRLQNILLNKF